MAPLLVLEESLPVALGLVVSPGLHDHADLFNKLHTLMIVFEIEFLDELVDFRDIIRVTVEDQEAIDAEGKLGI